MTPPSLKGKEFESLLMESAKREEAKGCLHMVRYGVQGITMGDKTILVPSLPDFDGVLAFPQGRQFIIEAKSIVSTSSFPLHHDKFKGKQYAHLSKRAQFGALSWLLIHFGERKLVKITHAAITVAVPVDGRISFWKRYELGQERMLSREMAVELGTIVPWVTPKGCRKALPDLLSFLDPQGVLRKGAEIQQELSI